MFTVLNTIRRWQPLSAIYHSGSDNMSILFNISLNVIIYKGIYVWNQDNVLWYCYYCMPYIILNRSLWNENTMYNKREYMFNQIHLFLSSAKIHCRITETDARSLLLYSYYKYNSFYHIFEQCICDEKKNNLSFLPFRTI